MAEPQYKINFTQKTVYAELSFESAEQCQRFLDIIVRFILAERASSPTHSSE